MNGCFPRGLLSLDQALLGERGQSARLFSLLSDQKPGDSLPTPQAAKVSEREASGWAGTHDGPLAGGVFSGACDGSVLVNQLSHTKVLIGFPRFCSQPPQKTLRLFSFPLQIK